MIKEKVYKLVKFLKKKGFNDIEIHDNYIDIFYTKFEIRIPIRIYIHHDKLSYKTPNCRLKYKKTGKFLIFQRKSTGLRRGGDVHGYFGGENIKKLRTKIKRKDINSAVLKNIKKIIEWVEPEMKKKKENQDDINNYTSELKFYFDDKYGKGNSTINIDNCYNGEKLIKVKIKKKNIIENQVIKYKNGEYILVSINQYYNIDKFIYKQRKKKI